MRYEISSRVSGHRNVVRACSLSEVKAIVSGVHGLLIEDVKTGRTMISEDIKYWANLGGPDYSQHSSFARSIIKARAFKVK